MLMRTNLTYCSVCCAGLENSGRKRSYPGVKSFFFSIIVVLMLSLLNPATASASHSPSWTWQNPLPQGEILWDVSAVDANTAWAVGGLGTILKTSNGTDWFSQTTRVTETLNSIDAVDANTAWTVGEMGTILNTTDGGATWNKVRGGTSVGLLEVVAFDFYNVWIVGYDGTILKTADAGVHWVHQTSGATTLSSISAVDMNTAWVVGGFGEIYKTVDGGANWANQSVSPPRSFFSVCACDINTAWAVGYFETNTTLLKTSDGGTWQVQGTPGLFPALDDISAVNTSIAWAVGGNYNSSYILHCTNGSTWNSQGAGSSEALKGVSAVNANTAWAVGCGGLIIKTTNGGSNWIRQITGDMSSISDISCVDSQTVWASSDSGKVFKTTNGGATWDTLSTSVSCLDGIFALDTNTVWAAADDGSVLRTTNGGLNWSRQILPPIRLDDIVALDSNTAWAVGSQGAIYKTTNGGASWNPQTSGTIYELVELKCVDANTLWVVGGDDHHGIVLKTSDGGQTWVKKLEGDYYFDAVDAADANTAWVGASMFGGMLKTADGGSSWKQQLSLTSGVSGISVVDSNTVWAVEGCGIMKTIDGGSIWEDTSEATGSEIYAVAAVDGQTAWVGGDAGAIIKTSDGGGFGSTFYFAEGYTGSGFEEWLCLMNPEAKATTAHITYMFADGTVQNQDIAVGATTRATVNVNDAVGRDKNVSIKVEADSPVVAERPMYFNYKGAWTGGHDVVGSSSPNISFYFAEGYTGSGFEEWLCLMNPEAEATTAHITYMFADGTTQNQDVAVGATTRATVNVNDAVGRDKNVSVKVAADSPIVAERPMYFNYKGVWTGGHDVIGSKDPGSTFYFAEGYTGSGFEEWLCLMNPEAEAVTAHVTYMFADGTTQNQDVAVGATTRATVNVNDVVGRDKNVSIQIRTEANLPIVAERPMYFNYKGAWTGGHDVVGSSSPNISFYFAEGYTGSGFEEWLCLMNPKNEATTAHITYMFADGTTKNQDVAVGATTRATVNVNDAVGRDKNVSVKVEADSPIVAERPMYFNYKGVWTGGHDVIGWSP